MIVCYGEKDSSNLPFTSIQPETMFNRFVIAAISIMSIIGCNPSRENADATSSKDSTAGSRVTSEPFGIMPDGTKISRYTLTNSNGMAIKVINYGGIITSILAPDRNGQLADVVLGYDSLSQYVENNPYFGALIGRYGNRIAKGKFTLDGEVFTLEKNNDQNHLHGGRKGFDKVVWNIEDATSGKGAAIRLRYKSPDKEEGYPGNLDISVLYTLTDNNELQLEYTANTDRKTIVNLTQHTYFNLNGAKNDILSHELMLNADAFLPVDQTLMPKGQPAKVSGTPFDFLKPKRIGADINADDEQLKFGKGYDHCWVLNSPDSMITVAAILYDPASGREVSVFTTEPGVQFYSGNFLDGSNKGKGGTIYQFRYGLCLETQHFPDSPNQPSFPSVVLEPGQAYRTNTVYKFGVR
jgi:aldose 1-epimerase